MRQSERNIKEKAADNHARSWPTFEQRRRTPTYQCRNLELPGRSSYFDTVGIQPDEFSDRTTDIGRQAQRADLWVFDWDRTISQAEGFYGASDTAKTATGAWNVYKQSVRKSTKQGVPEALVSQPFGVQQAFTNPNQMKMLCGGTERYENLSRLLRKKRGQYIHHHRKSVRQNDLLLRPPFVPKHSGGPRHDGARLRRAA